MMQRLIGNDETADVLREMAREFHQPAHECLELFHHQAVGIETARAQFFVVRFVAGYARKHRRQLIERVVGKSERAADIARGTFAAIADHGRGERGAVASIFVEDVLDDFFAAFVLEIHVDIRRLVALARKKTFEQKIAVFRIDRRDAEAVAHGRIGRRAASLTQDRRLRFGAGPAHDVFDGEKEMFEFQFLDQCEFFFDLFADFLRSTVRPQMAHAFFGQIAQMRNGRHPFRDDLVRIGVFQFSQIEFDLIGDTDRFFEQVGRINP